MITNQKVLGLVLAREGSKGLPGKNTMLLCGKPLIAWSIEAGLASRYIDDLVVSTDGDEIASVSKQYGAEVPFIRPSEFASDGASSVSAILHTLDYLEEHGRCYDLVVLLEPTSPLRETADIDTTLELLVEKNASSVVSVCAAEANHPSFMFKMDSATKKLLSFTGVQPNVLRRQDIEPVFFLDGTIYCSTSKKIREKKGFYHEETLAYEVPKWKSLEIDDADDFLMVEAVMKSRLKIQ